MAVNQNIEGQSKDGICTLKECCKALRSEVRALKECNEQSRNQGCPVQDCFELLRNKNQKLKRRVSQLEMNLAQRRSSVESNDIVANAKWTQNGVIVAGGHGYGNGLNQLWEPHGISIDDDNKTIYIADSDNHRIVAWNYGSSTGQVVAGGNGKGSQNDQLSFPRNVIVDAQTDSLIICDWGNQRVVRWPRQNGISGEVIIANIECFGGITFDDNESLYVSDFQKNHVKRWRKGETDGTIVAGGNGDGNGLNQLNSPTYIFVDQDRSIYISDKDDHRIMKWIEGAQEGIIVAGGQGKGNDPAQLKYPYGLIVDQLGTIYVADSWNNRIMRWPKGATQGSIVVGGNGEGDHPNQFDYPIGLAFDRLGHLYIADYNNHRVLKFQID